MSDNCPKGSPQENCFWLREKEYVSREIRDIKVAVKELHDKLDSYRDTVLGLRNQGKQVEELENKMSLSREELATMKVKMSLMGVGAAALVEIIFVIAKHLQK